MGWVVVVLIVIAIFIFFSIKRSSGQSRENTTPRRTTAVAPPKRLSKKHHTTSIVPPKRLSEEEKEIRRLLNFAYRTKQRLTIKYETGYPLPGDPPIKIRDIDIYGIGEDYFEAYCHYRCEVRTFKISRVLLASLSNEIYGIPHTYTPNTWVTEGWGEIDNDRLELIDDTSSKRPNLPMPKDVHIKYEEDELRRKSKEAIPYGRGGEGTGTHVRYDWRRQFEESILTPFPEEWSPALPHLHEAYRLEKEGADREKIHEVLEKARKADKDATAFYIGRLSIIKKIQRDRHQKR